MRGSVVKVPKLLKGKLALMKDKKKAKAYLKMMVDAIKWENEWKNRRRSEKGDKDEQ